MLGKPRILFSRHTHAQLHSGPIKGREWGVLTNQRPGQRARHAAGVTNSLAGISWEAPPAPAVAGDSRKLTG